MFGRNRDDEFELDEPRQDREITLGPAMLLGIFFGLVLLCGLFFGWGYTQGRKSALGMRMGLTVTQSAAGQTVTAPPGGSLSKPLAKGTVPSTPAVAVPVAPVSSGDGSSNPLTSYGSTASTGDAELPAQVQSTVHTALPVASGGQAPVAVAQTQAAPPPAVAPPAAQGPGMMVQVAAVSHMDDANVLMNALRKRGYAVMARRGFSDNLIHVQVGPFASRADANAMSQRLLSDGYNATVLPQ